MANCLEHGIIPHVIPNGGLDTYELTMKYQEKETYPSRLKSPFQSEEEMLAKAMDGYFVRDPERNLVICPAGIYPVHK